MCRLAQTLNVYWEKTPESVLYTAVQTAVDNLDGVQLIDYTSTENACLSHLPGKWLLPKLRYMVAQKVKLQLNN